MFILFVIITYMYISSDLVKMSRTLQHMLFTHNTDNLNDNYMHVLYIYVTSP